VLAEGKDPSETKAGELSQGKPVTIGADDSVEEALKTMTKHKVRRLPVIDGHDLIGVVSQADLAQELTDDQVSDLVESISATGWRLGAREASGGRPAAARSSEARRGQPLASTDGAGCGRNARR
jgi:hypothetical protein